MKTIILKMDDDVFDELDAALFVRGMIAADSHGIVDELFIKMMIAIKNGDEEKHFSFVKPTKDETK